MFGLDPVTISAAYILAATGICPAVQPPTVQMEFIDTPPVERNDLSGHDLGAFHISTTFSHSRNEVFTVGGLTVSDFSPVYLVDFALQTDQMTGNACIAIQSVKITVKYAPTIYVASEFGQGGCRFQSTLQHEARHVNTDIITFNEFLPVLRQAVQDAADKVGAVGPLKPEDLIPARDRIIDKLKTALAAKTDEIEQIRFNRQQAIDTRLEYMRMSKLCPDEAVPHP